MWNLKEKNMKVYNIDHKYTDFSRKYDQIIPSEHDYHSRPFIGILISNGNIDYVVSLTSPKPKHLKMKNNIDFLKKDGGKLTESIRNRCCDFKKLESIYK